MEQKKAKMLLVTVVISIILFLLAAAVLLLPEGFFETALGTQPGTTPLTEPSNGTTETPRDPYAQAHIDRVLSADFPLFYYSLGSLDGGGCYGYCITYIDGSEGPMEQMASLKYVEGSHYEMVGWFEEPTDLLVGIFSEWGNIREEYYLHIAYNYETEEYEITTSPVEKEENEASAGYEGRIEVLTHPEGTEDFPDRPVFALDLVPKDWESDERYSNGFQIEISYGEKTTTLKDEHFVITYQYDERGNELYTTSSTIYGWFEEPTTVTVTVLDGVYESLIEWIMYEISYDEVTKEYIVEIVDHICTNVTS